MLSLKEVLHNEGLKYTQQRQAVWHTLRASIEHRDAEEIYLTLKQDGLTVSRATVYRTVDVLVKNNMINKLDIGDGRLRFEYNIDSEHHDHLICTECGKIVEFQNNEIEKLQERIAKKYKFKLLEHNHQLFGICKDCQ